MSTTEVGAVAASQPPTIQAAPEPEKKLSQILKEKFIEGKDYVLKHKGAFAKIGQIGGTAALVAGGMSLLFSGIAANLSIAGIPLGIPLMVAGGILLTVGTILQVAHQIEKKDLGVGEKIKGFFKETFNNLKIGTLAGVGIGAVCAILPLKALIAIVPVAIKLKPYIFKDLNKEENWKGVVDALPAGSVKKNSEGTKTFNEFWAKILKPLTDTVESIEKRKAAKPAAPAKVVEPAVPAKVVQTDLDKPNAQEYEDVSATLAQSGGLTEVPA